MIRPFQIDDTPQVNSLLSQLWDDVSVNHQKIWDIVNTQNKQVFVYQSNNAVIATIIISIKELLWAQSNVLEIDALVVDQYNRNIGIGKKLLQYVETIANKNNCSYVEFNSAFRRTNAHEFYQKCGYEKTAFVFDKSINYTY